MATTFSASCSTTSNYNLHYPKNFNIHSSISHQFIKNPLQIFSKGLRLSLNNERNKAVNGERVFKTTSWDEKPFEVLPNGRKFPKFQKKGGIGCYISLIQGTLINVYLIELISAAWEAAGTRYDDAKLAEMSSSTMLSAKNDAVSLEFWNCRKSGGPIPLALISHLQKALFRTNGKIYGRLIGVSTLARIATSFSPLYFTVKEVHEVMPTEQPCDLAYEFGDGHLDLQDYPEGFPKPGRHPRPFNDQVVIYVRHVGPGVMAGQAWQEGIVLEQVPKKLCGEILMVKDYSTYSADSR
ncbi:hypothetical protein KSS87_022739 [Heliosperma pusillum]|nr:hypothetical protein KSS87_022739 [Heliosperma pusillum]